MSFLFGLVIAVIIGGAAAFYWHRREEVFEGNVIDKEVRTITDNSNPNNTMRMTREEYYIKIQTTAGKDISWSVSPAKYQIIKVGDHVTKPKGTTDLAVTPSVPQPPATPSATPPTTPSAIS